MFPEPACSVTNTTRVIKEMKQSNFPVKCFLSCCLLTYSVQRTKESRDAENKSLSLHPSLKNDLTASQLVGFVNRPFLVIIQIYGCISIIFVCLLRRMATISERTMWTNLTENQPHAYQHFHFCVNQLIWNFTTINQLARRIHEILSWLPPPTVCLCHFSFSSIYFVTSNSGQNHKIMIIFIP